MIESPIGTCLLSFTYPSPLPTCWLIKNNWLENLNHFFKIPSALLSTWPNLRSDSLSWSQTQTHSSWGVYQLSPFPLQQVSAFSLVPIWSAFLDPSRGINIIHLHRHWLGSQRLPSPAQAAMLIFSQASRSPPGLLFSCTLWRRTCQASPCCFLISSDLWCLPKINAAASFPTVVACH